MTPDSATSLTRETAFHPRTSALSKSFVPYRGYWQPTAFQAHGPVEEYYACREHAAIMDLSALRKFEILGPDAEELLQRTLTRDVARLATGHVVYSAMCNDTGGVMDDGTLFRLGEMNFRWCCNDEYDGIWLREKADAFRLNVRIKDSSDQIHNLALQGPDSLRILEQIVYTAAAQPAMSELARFRFVVGRISGSQGIPVMISRTGYTGGLGYEVWCHPRDALGVWDAIWSAGAPLGLKPAGSAALDMLRIEAGLVFAGQEFDDETDPFEAGIGFVVALKAKAGVDFVGKAALMRRKLSPNRMLVGLVLDGNETARHGEGVFVGRSRVGVITSGTRSPILRKSIALCRIAIEHSAEGSKVEVGKLDGHQKRLSATVVPLPFLVLDR